MQDHRKLRAWQSARELAIAIRRATRAFPRSGYASLSSQVIRAAESVVLTIAEGCGAATQRELARFLDMSIKSTLEIEAQLELAKDYGVLDGISWKTLTGATIDVRRMLCGLRAKVLLSADAEEKAARQHREKQQTKDSKTSKERRRTR